VLVRVTAAVLLAACRGAPPADGARDTLVASPSAPVDSVPRRCGQPTLSDSAVGAVRLGTSVADLTAECNVVRDRTEARSEGQLSRVLAVVLAGDTIEAEVVDDRVWRVDVDSPAFRTADSLGVGTPLATMLALPGLQPMSGEGRVFVKTARHCGLSFQLSVPDTGAAAGRWTVEELRRLSEGTKVARVLVVGCA
jgi:hypothetical protein